MFPYIAASEAGVRLLIDIAIQLAHVLFNCTPATKTNDLRLLLLFCLWTCQSWQTVSKTQGGYGRSELILTALFC